MRCGRSHRCAAGDEPDQQRQAGRHTLVEREEVDQLLGDRDEDLADPIHAEPVGERYGRGEHRAPTSPVARPAATPGPNEIERRSPAAILGRATAHGDQRRREDQQPAEGDLLPHQGQIGELYSPTSATKIAPAPPISPARTIDPWVRHPSDLLRFARTQEPTRTEDQDEHQHQEREGVLQLERGRDAVPGEDERRAERLQESQQDAAQRGAGCCRSRPGPPP